MGTVEIRSHWLLVNRYINPEFGEGRLRPPLRLFPTQTENVLLFSLASRSGSSEGLKIHPKIQGASSNILRIMWSSGWDIQAGPSMMWFFYACYRCSMRIFLKFPTWLAQNDIFQIYWYIFYLLDSAHMLPRGSMRALSSTLRNFLFHQAT